MCLKLIVCFKCRQRIVLLFFNLLYANAKLAKIIPKKIHANIIFIIILNALLSNISPRSFDELELEPDFVLVISVCSSDDPVG